MRANDRNALRAEFADLDEKLIRSSAGRVMAACNSRRPSKRVGAVATILREGEKKKRHMPIRELLVRTREDALALKPCFMMSPLSVSQFLPSDIQFDVVLFDEASQIRPHDAINCIYRGRQHVIAGDQKQLPPSIFFEGVREEEGDEWVEDELESYESILDKAKSCQSIRSLPLLWHYRSRHEDLITFSNVSFYDGELHSFPAPHNGSPLLGVGFHRVDGIYRRGTTSDNEIEAQRVAELVAVYAKEHPSLSLGVVAFSKAQGEAIENAIERMRIADPEVPNDYFCDERLNGFFVKNLETVQGDERDVIILSVGYGPDETGKLTLNFGPINQAGGFRRLNVAVTRARLRLELVASMTAGHIASAAENEGVRHLRNYLRYAEEGPSSLLRADEKSLGDVESVFEASVAEVIRSWGYEVATQVGSAGYRIDLTIVHPDEPGRHCLAVECDGAMYHSSRVARDRDRLRDAVLGGLGWRIHRIWGPAWYRQREQAEERLRQAIEAAVAHCSNSEVVFPPHVREEPEPAVTINTQRISEGFKTAHWVAPYTIGQPSLTTMDRAIQMGDRSASRIMKRLIPEVVRIEQPVCRELVLDRLKAAWGTKRAGKNVQSEFETAVSELLRAEEVFTDADGFLWVDATCPLRLVRRPVDSDDRTHRTCPQVAPAEFDLAVRGVLDGVTSIGQHELRRNVAELFGWERVGADIGKAIDTAVTRVLTSGGVESRILSDEAAPRVSANRETAEKAKGKPGVSRTPPASASRQSKPASQASLSDEDAAKCAICKGRFGERSRPTKLVFEESSGKVSKTAHSSCLEQLKGRAIRVPGYDWDGQRNALLPCPSAKSSVDGNTGAQKRAREAPPEKKRKKSRQKRAEEPVSTDIDLIREIERKNRARLEENKKKHGGLYDSTPWEQ